MNIATSEKNYSLEKLGYYYNNNSTTYETLYSNLDASLNDKIKLIPTLMSLTLNIHDFRTHLFSTMLMKKVFHIDLEIEIIA